METLGAKIFFTNELESYTNKELEEMKQIIQNEQNQRYTVRRSQAWERMIGAIRAYTNEFSCIEISEGERSVCITSNFIANFEKETIID